MKNNMTVDRHTREISGITVTPQTTYYQRYFISDVTSVELPQQPISYGNPSGEVMCQPCMCEPQKLFDSTKFTDEMTRFNDEKMGSSPSLANILERSGSPDNNGI